MDAFQLSSCAIYLHAKNCGESPIHTVNEDDDNDYVGERATSRKTYHLDFQEDLTQRKVILAQSDCIATSKLQTCYSIF